MNELLRFVAVRPAKPADPNQTVPSQASGDVVTLIQNTPSPDERARVLVQQPVHTDFSDYRYASAMAELGAWARDADLSRHAVTAKAKAILGTDPSHLGGQQAFADDVAQLDTTLAVIKYRSQSIGPALLALQNA